MMDKDIDGCVLYALKVNKAPPDLELRVRVRDNVILSCDVRIHYFVLRVL